MKKKYRIVDQNDQVIDSLAGLSLTDAEHLLCKYINHGFDCYIQDEDELPAIKKYRAKNISRERVYELIGIGFCQPKFYKQYTWRQAKALMDEVVCNLGLATPFDYGRGKGKFTSNLDINLVQETVANLICID